LINNNLKQLKEVQQMIKYICEENKRYYTFKNYKTVEVFDNLDQYEKISVNEFINKTEEITNNKINELLENISYKVNDNIMTGYDSIEKIDYFILMDGKLAAVMHDTRVIYTIDQLDTHIKRKDEYIEKKKSNDEFLRKQNKREEKEKARIEKEYKYFNAYVKDLNFSAMQTGKLKKVLDKKYRYDIDGKKVILTRKEYILYQVLNGCRIEQKTFNDKICYMLFKANENGVFNEITKTEYLFSQWLQVNIRK
jgi:hypothetical protein